MHPRLGTVATPESTVAPPSRHGCTPDRARLQPRVGTVGRLRVGAARLPDCLSQQLSPSPYTLTIPAGPRQRRRRGLVRWRVVVAKMCSVGDHYSPNEPGPSRLDPRARNGAATPENDPVFDPRAKNGDKQTLADQSGGFRDSCRTAAATEPSTWSARSAARTNDVDSDQAAAHHHAARKPDPPSRPGVEASIRERHAGKHGP